MWARAAAPARPNHAPPLARGAPGSSMWLSMQKEGHAALTLTVDGRENQPLLQRPCAPALLPAILEHALERIAHARPPVHHQLDTSERPHPENVAHLHAEWGTCACTRRGARAHDVRKYVRMYVRTHAA